MTSPAAFETESYLALMVEQMTALAANRDREVAHFDADCLLLEALWALAAEGVHAEQLAALCAAWKLVRKAYC